MGQKRPVSIEKRPFLGLQHNSRNSKQICLGLQHNSRNSGTQKGRWARNGPFPFNNGLFLVYRAPKAQMGQKRPVSIQKKNLFLVYSTIAEIQSKFDHFGPQKGRWARNGPFPLKNGFFLVYSTIAEIQSKFVHFGPQKGRWARNGPFPLTAFSWSTAHSRNSKQI